MSRRNYDRHETRRCRQFPQIRQFPASPEHSRSGFRQFLPHQSQTKTTAQHHREGETTTEPQDPTSGGRGSRRAGRQCSVFSFQCSVIAKSPREGDNTNTQNAQISALFRVIPRPSFPAEPPNPGRRKAPAEPSTPREGEAPAEPDVSVQFSVFSVQCSVFSDRKMPSGGRQHQHTKPSNFRVIPRHSAAIVSRRAAKPSKAQGSCRAMRSKRSAQRELRPPKGEKPDAGNPRFGIVSVLRGPLFVNTCGNATCNRAQDFELIKKKRAGLNRLAS